MRSYITKNKMAAAGFDQSRDVTLRNEKISKIIFMTFRKSSNSTILPSFDFMISEDFQMLHEIYMC